MTVNMSLCACGGQKEIVGSRDGTQVTKLSQNPDF